MAPTRQRLVACDCGQLLRGRYSARLVQCTHTTTQQAQHVQQVRRGAQMSERERRACPLGLVCLRECPHAAARGVVTQSDVAANLWVQKGAQMRQERAVSATTGVLQASTLSVTQSSR